MTGSEGERTSRDRFGRGRLVLAFLLLVSAVLLFDSLLHLFRPAALEFLHFGQGRAEWLARIGIVLFLLGSLAYIWRSFRRQGQLQASLVDLARERQDAALKFNEVLDSIPDRISIQDPSYRILYQNRAHRALMGDQVGRLCHEAYARQPEVCSGCPLVGVFADGRLQRQEKQTVIGEQSTWVEINASPLRDSSGAIVAAIEVVRDTTRRREREEAVRRLTERLRESNSELEAFGSSLAHDLRQPLTRIYLSAQALDELRAAGSDPTRDFLVKNVLDGCEEMERLVEAMLVLGRVTRHELRCDRVDLSSLCQEIALELRAADPGRRGVFEIHPDIVVYGDPALLRILMKNLLSNAWKYSSRQRDARVQVEPCTEPGRAGCRVSDNGVGFDMSDVGRLFQPFERLHSGKEFPGTGIGLVTARRVVLRHDGRIWAESRPGGGAVFSFTLPAVPDTSSSLHDHNGPPRERRTAEQSPNPPPGHLGTKGVPSGPNP